MRALNCRDLQKANAPYKPAVREDDSGVKPLAITVVDFYVRFQWYNPDKYFIT